MEQNIFSKIKANMEFYSAVEKKIAEEILHDPNRFIGYSMSELSQAAGVSQGSINNFAKKISGDGFSALKLHIAKQLPQYEKKTFSLVKEGDGVKDILQKTMDGITTALGNTLALNDEETLQSITQKILCAKKIELYGIFQSGLVARDFYYQLLQLGLPANFVSDVLTAPISAAMLDSSGLVIAISSSGRTKDILDAVKIAKSNGAGVICITSSKNSPLAKVSDEVLLTASSGTSISGKSEEARLSQIFLADSICSYIRYQIDKDGENQYFRLRHILDSHSVKD